MRTAFIRGMAATAVAGSMLALSPQVALAGGNSCWNAALACDLNASGFPGGDMSVTADVHGQGIGKWGVSVNGQLVCGENWFDANAGPQTWNCKFLPVGQVYAYSHGPRGPVSLSVSW